MLVCTAGTAASLSLSLRTWAKKGGAKGDTQKGTCLRMLFGVRRPQVIHGLRGLLGLRGLNGRHEPL